MMAAEDLPALASVADECGYDAIAMPDSVFYPETISAGYPYSADGKRMWTGQTPMPDPLIAMTAMAAVTKRVHFYTNVLKLPLREPLVLAKQIATMAVMSDNRIGLGVGLSWIPEEFRFTGTDMRTRGARTDEALEILKSVCSGRGPEWVEYHGKYYDFDRLMMSPAPAEPVPIYVGGHSEPALRRAARLADGWISVNTDVAQLRTAIDRLTVLRAEYGRDELSFEIDASPTDVADIDNYRALADIGVTRCRVMPWRLYGADPADRQARIDAVRRFADDCVD